MTTPQQLSGLIAAYELFAELYLHGLRPDLAERVAVIPELAGGAPEGNNEDQQAAHYQLFGFNAFPFAGVYLDPELNIGGWVTSQWVGFYEHVGFQADHSESIEHVGVALQALAYLLRQEQAGDATEWQNHQRTLMAGQALGWLPGFVKAVRQQGSGFYANLAEATLGVVLHHAELLGSPAPREDVIEDLPAPPDLLANDKTGLKDIAEYLSTPLYCGFFLSRDDIGRLGRQFSLPRGFGKRTQMLTNLLRAAVDYDALPDLLAEIDLIRGKWAGFYDELQAQIPEWAAFWLARLSHSQAVLANIQVAVEEAHDEV